MIDGQPRNINKQRANLTASPSYKTKQILFYEFNLTCIAKESRCKGTANSGTMQYP